MAYDHTPYTATKLPYGAAPTQTHPAYRRHGENRLYPAFKTLAGEDNEIDPWELQDILNNTMNKDSELGNVTFSVDSCRSMIAMFDADRSGKLGFEEFLELWKYVNAWAKIFKTYDSDGSGTFSGKELHTALTTLGYKMDVKIYQALILRYANKDSQITFDSFISCAIKLRHMHEVYNKYMDRSDRKATFKLEEFVGATMYS